MLPLVALLLFLSCSRSVVATGAGVCPDIPAAATRHLLEVTDGQLTLPSGKKVPGLLYNESYIGPLLTATLGEEISVDVTNKASVGTSVHWHGMDLPDAAWADGVDTVTQQPIPTGKTFRYKFKAGPAGTLWYHSHVGMQFADGLRGPLIVKDPKDPYKGSYDEEVVLLLTDQNAESGEAELKALQDGKASMSMGVCTEVSNQDWSDAPFTTILTNGKGFMRDPATKKALGSPHVIKVQQGKRYRFRVIQGAASWGIKVKVAGHAIDVIALDGSNVQPTLAKGFVFTPGERVDFILHANQSVGNYQIDIATLTGNNSPALLSYVGADEKAAAPPQLSLGCSWARYDPDILDFKNVTLKPHASVPAPPSKPDVTLAVYLINGADPAQSQEAVLGSSKSVLGMNATAKPQSGCSKLPDGRDSQYCWQQNWIEYDGAKNGVPLLFPDTKPGAQTYIQEVPFGAVVDVVLINPATMLHPMHLHGQRFWVLGTGNGQILTPAGKVDYSKLNSGRAIMRDTQPVANAIPAAAKPPMAAGSPATGGGMPAKHGRKLLQSMAGMDMPAATPSPKPEAMAGMSGMPAPAMAAPKPDGMAGMAGMPAKPAAMAPAATPAGMSGMPAPATAAPKPDGMAGMAGMPAKPAAMTPAATPADMSGMPAPATAAPKPDGMAGMAGMPAAAPAMSAVPAATKASAAPNSMAGNSMAAEPAALTPGWAVIRFKADNPGMWAFHCHIDLHANSGMLMAFKVAAPAGAGRQQAQPWSLPKDVTACGQAKNASPVESADGMQQASVKVPLPEDKPAPAATPARSAAGRVPAGSLLLQWSLAAALCMIAAMGLA